MHITLTNVDLNNPVEVSIPLDGVNAKLNGGEILTAKAITDYNDFGQAEKVTIRPFDGAKIKKGMLNVNIPAKSVISIDLSL